LGTKPTFHLRTAKARRHPEADVPPTPGPAGMGRGRTNPDPQEHRILAAVGAKGHLLMMFQVGCFVASRKLMQKEIGPTKLRLSIKVRSCL